MVFPGEEPGKNIEDPHLDLFWIGLLNLMRIIQDPHHFFQDLVGSCKRPFKSLPKSKRTFFRS